MMTQNSGRSPLDVADILTSDHQDMVDLISEIERTPDAHRRRELADTVIAEVMRHAVAEEMYVYPALKKHIPDGEKAVELDKQEHAEIVQVMKQMENLDASDPSFMQQVHKLEGLIRHHAQEEESKQFPQLRAHIPGEKMIELGEKVVQAKQLAPTRPHPSAPHSELFHKTVGAGVGMVDRLRDKLTGRNTG